MASETAAIARSIWRTVAGTELWRLSCQSFGPFRKSSEPRLRFHIGRCEANSSRSSFLRQKKVRKKIKTPPLPLSIVASMRNQFATKLRPRPKIFFPSSLLYFFMNWIGINQNWKAEGRAKTHQFGLCPLYNVSPLHCPDPLRAICARRCKTKLWARYSVDYDRRMDTKRFAAEKKSVFVYVRVKTFFFSRPKLTWNLLDSYWYFFSSHKL